MNTTPLKAMFWKECRENARWAILALLALSLGLVYAWYHLYQQSSFPSLGQIWSGENLVLTLLAPLIALALALLQVLPELRRDQWAFLVHRPASRTTLFFGKALPGVCLYLLATILPLLGLAAWAAQPSHVPAPFDFRFTLAGWAAILAGLPFYFAGLLVALRPARWYGSRALPLLTALLGPWAAMQLTEFLPVVFVCLLVAAVLLCAAWGSFVSGGEYAEQPKPARFALGLTLYPAVLAVGVGALMLTVQTYNTLGGNSLGAGQWWRNDYKIDTQGHLFYTSEHYDGKGHTDKTVTDLAGHPVDPRLWQNLNQQHKLLGFAYLPESDPATNYSRYSQANRYVLSLDSTISDVYQTYWYYETGARQIVGYSVTTQVPSIIGYLGPNGFARERDQAGRFTGPRPELTQFLGTHLLRFSEALYWYDTSVPALGILQSLPGGGSGSAVVGLSDSGRSEKAATLIVAAGKQLTAYVPGISGAAQTAIPRKLFTIPVAVLLDAKASTNIEAAMTPDRSRFFFWYGAWGGSGTGSLVTVASNGRVLKTEAVPPLKQTGTAAEARFVQASPMVVVPPTALSALALFGYVGHRLGWDSAAGFWNSLPGFGSQSFFSALGGLVAAVLAGLISRRLGDGRRGQVAWALGVFWLGGYGVLLLLSLRAWPVRVPCPHCGRLRVVDREACEHCGAAWARPRRDGTEIFDADNTEVMAR